MKVVPNVCLLISKMMLLKGNKTLMELIVYVNRQKQAKYQYQVSGWIQEMIGFGYFQK